MFEVHADDTPEDFEVVEIFVCAGVIGHEFPEESPDEVLEADGEPVDCSPGGVLCYDSGEEARQEDAEHEACGDDGEGEGSAVWWGEVSYQRSHELRRDGCYRCDELDCGEDLY